MSCSAMEPDELFALVSKSVMLVNTYGRDNAVLGSGSAVTVAPGKLVTNCHVLAKAHRIEIKQENVSYIATLEHIDVERDLCQIAAKNFHAPPVKIGDSDKLKVGQKVYAIGNPRRLELTLSDGLISALRRDDNDALMLIQTSAPISMGSSGGGLFDSNARLIGITTLTNTKGQNLNFAIPINWLRDLPERSRAALAKAAESEKSADNAKSPDVKNYSGPLRIGDQWEYQLTDRLTNLRRSITYRIDSIDGDADRVVFNQGGRVEDTQGRVIDLKTPNGGEFDAAMPPGGWISFPLEAGKTWREKYKGRVLNYTSYDLTATVAGEETVVVPAGEFPAVRIEWKGYAGTGRGLSLFNATVWYSNELKRVVKFTIDALTNGKDKVTAPEILELASRPFRK